MDILRKSRREKGAYQITSTEENNPRRVDFLYVRILPFLVRHRYLTVVAAVVVIVLIALSRHLLFKHLGYQPHWLVEAGLFAVLLPAFAFPLLNMLHKTERERNQAASSMNQQAELSRCLGDACTWEALVACIAAYPQQVVPRAVVTLVIYHPESRLPWVEAICALDGNITQRPQRALAAENQPVGSDLPIWEEYQPAEEMPVLSAAQPAVNGRAGELPPNRHDLHITRNGQKTGTLILELPTGSTLTPSERRALRNAVPLIAMALESGLQQNLAAARASARETERQKIAQNLHDTLAQNISYLRLKLDQLTGENAIQEIGVVLQELERMRATADEAYTQVRQTLEDLAPFHSEDLVATIDKQAQAICERSALRLRTSQTGNPYSLPGPVCQQISFIAREALHNVEKHASAESVRVQFLWLEAELIVKITDDGIGFNPASIPPDGHYGLWIMQQRAEEMGGTLKITPSDENGTEVTLWIPRPAVEPGTAEKNGPARAQ